MPTGGSVKLTVDSDKTAYVILPNGVLLTTVAGVINTTYTGLEGNILYLIPKAATVLSIDNSDIAGEITYTATTTLSAAACVGLTSVIVSHLDELNVAYSSLTAKSIGDILAVANGLSLVVAYNFSGGLNAIKSEVNSYLLAEYDSTYDSIYANLVTTIGGTILIDEV